MVKIPVNSYPLKLLSFYNQNKDLIQKQIINFNQAYTDDSISYFKINFNFDSNVFLQECQKIDHLFINHRSSDNFNGYNHKGWSSITLHGIEYNKTEHFTNYGYKTLEEANYHWTSICQEIPNIYNFLLKLPYSILDRVRIMKLSPYGYIMPHNDNQKRVFGPLNIAINNPDKCYFIFENIGIVPFKPSIGFILDVSKNHCVVNMSNQNRYHIIVHGHFKKELFNE